MKHSLITESVCWSLDRLDSSIWLVGLSKWQIIPAIAPIGHMFIIVASLSNLLVVAEIEYFDILKYINENKNMDLIMDFKNYQENTIQTVKIVFRISVRCTDCGYHSIHECIFKVC